MEKPDLLTRLVDFDRHGLTATERFEMRMEAWKEIRELRKEIKRLNARQPKAAPRVARA